ncbi:MAG TPA: aldo/keto reductase [Cellulomonas sp.]
MKTAPLGASGIEVSALALGCMQMGTRMADEASFGMLDRYAAHGGAFLDTADCYAWWWDQGTDGGQSEDVLGRWMAARGNRDEVFVATKGTARIDDVARAWPASAAAPDWDYARDHFVGAATLRESLEASLRRLRTDRIDLYYVHVDDRRTPLEESLGTLASFVTEGKVRHLGWSNVRTWRMERIRQLCATNGWPAPVALQEEYSYLRPDPGVDDAGVTGGEQLDYLAAHPDLTLVAYSPVLKGLYDLPPERRGSVEIAGRYSSPDTLRRLAAVRLVADELGVLPSQVVLAWLAQHSPRVIPVIGTATPERLDRAVAALELGLSTDQLAQLAAG